MIRIRGVMAAVALTVAAVTAGHAEDPFTVDVTLKDHVFDPSTIKVPAGKPILIRLKNLDPTAEEFDSTALKIEKVIAGRGEGTVRLRPLDPGQYPFIGEYNESTAKGVVIASEVAMIGAMIIVFREVLEAGLIVGIVLAVTRGVARRGAYVAAGILAGVVGASLVAAFAGAISDALSGMGQELFNATVMGVAVVMLCWHNVWTARHGREMAEQMRNLGGAVAEGSRSLTALAIVVAVAVLREGSEIVLFLYGIVLSGGASASGLLVGGVLGLLLGAGVTGLTYFGLVAVPTRHLFRVTTALVSLLAAGMAGQCVLFLQQAGAVTALSRTLWDTSGVLPDDGILGRVLHTIMGYSDRPSELQVIAFVLTLAVIYLLMKAVSSDRMPRAQPSHG